MRGSYWAIRLVPCLRRPLLLNTRLSAKLAKNIYMRHSFSTSEEFETLRRQYISLYNYTPLDKHKLPKLRRAMHEQWGDLDIVGRIYIAEEGINAQLAVPEPTVNAFRCSFPRLLQNAKLFYGQLIDSTPIQTGKLNAAEPFHKLDIRIRKQILHDGFQGGELNLQESGQSLQPEQWHKRLKKRNEVNDSETLVLDVRNFYEYEIGRFDGSTRIMVDTYRDTFNALDNILERHEKEHQGHKPKEVMMYCTGGIRCEKIGAYLTQYKGISNVQKLHGGIINYVHFLKEQRHVVAENSLFKGKIFVFDQRCVAESEEVTDDVLGHCFQCGEPCNQHTNCSNVMCHSLSLQCSTCATTMLGACSEACKREFNKMESMCPEEQRHYRKANAFKWKPRNPNSVSALKFIKFRLAAAKSINRSEI